MIVNVLLIAVASVLVFWVAFWNYWAENIAAEPSEKSATSEHANDTGGVFSEESIVDGHAKAPVRASRFRLALVYLALLAGVLTTAIYRELTKDGHVNWMRCRTAMIIGAIVSPIILRTVLDSHSIRRDPLHKSALNAYQSGFCWETLLTHAVGSAQP